MNFSPRRRDFLRLGTIALGSPLLRAALPAVVSGAQPGDSVRSTPASSPRAKACILLFMDGGPPHQDLWDMKPDAADEVRGPFKPISTTVPAIQICEHLPHVARQMHRLMLVRSMSHEETIHPQALYKMLTGRPHDLSLSVQRAGDSDFPHIGSTVAALDRSPAAMPKFVRLPETMFMDGQPLRGQTAGYLGPAFDPLPLDVSSDLAVGRPPFALDADVTHERFAGRRGLLARLERRVDRLLDGPDLDRFQQHQRQALELLARPTVHDAFQLEREPAELRDRYGRNRHGQSVLLARRLVEAGARFVTVYWGREKQDWADGKPERIANNPWDGHRNHFPLIKESLAPRADQALAALVEDLSARGLYDDTLVVWMGDFGRTPKITRPWASRDHWPGAFSVVLGGAGIRGGSVYGKTDRLAAEVTENPVSPADLTATILDSLGLDPRTTVAGPQGTPYAISPGKVKSEWFG